MTTTTAEVVQHALGHLKVKQESGFLSQYVLNPSLDWNQLIYLCQFFVGISILRYVLAGFFFKSPTSKFKSVFERLFTRYCHENKVRKFAENLWYTMWHSTSFIWCLTVLYKESWSPSNGQPGWPYLIARDWDTRWYLIPTPGEQADGNPGWPLLTVSNTVSNFYVSELGFWLSCLLFIGLETRRNDFSVMLSHHIVTILLVGVSFLCSFWRIGLIVIATHDIGDIFLYGAKTMHYSIAPPAVVNLLFVFFVLAFFFSRLIFFPLFCVRPSFEVSQWKKWSGGLVESHWDVPGGIACPASLCFLQIVHVFWFGLILRMVVRTLKTKTVEGDIRSDAEDEDDEDDSESASNDEEDKVPPRTKALKGSSGSEVKKNI